VTPVEHIPLSHLKTANYSQQISMHLCTWMGF
jgi:hypothetical protein